MELPFVALKLKEGRGRVRVKSALRTGIGALPRRRFHDAEEKRMGKDKVSRYQGIKVSTFGST